MGVLVAGFVVGTLYGPLAMLRDVTPEQLASEAYWLDVAAATLRAAASTGIALGGIVAAALGLPVLAEARRTRRTDGDRMPTPEAPTATNGD